MISRPRVPRGRDPGYFLLVQKLDGCSAHPRHLERLCDEEGGTEGRRKGGGRHLWTGEGSYVLLFAWNFELLGNCCLRFQTPEPFLGELSLKVFI